MLIQSYPYFVFDGNAAEAVEFYAEVFNAKVLNITYFHDMPDDPDFKIPDETKDLIMNGTIKLPNGEYLMFSDNMPGMPFTIGDNMTAILVYDNIEETQKIFKRLSEGGEVIMDVQETFWSAMYGNLKDKFGNQWQLDTDLEGNYFEELEANK